MKALVFATKDGKFVRPSIASQAIVDRQNGISRSFEPHGVVSADIFKGAEDGLVRLGVKPVIFDRHIVNTDHVVMRVANDILSYSNNTVIIQHPKMINAMSRLRLLDEVEMIVVDDPSPLNDEFVTHFEGWKWGIKRSSLTPGGDIKRAVFAVKLDPEVKIPRVTKADIKTALQKLR